MLSRPACLAFCRLRVQDCCSCHLAEGDDLQNNCLFHAAGKFQADLPKQQPKVKGLPPKRAWGNVLGLDNRGWSVQSALGPKPLQV